MNHHISQPTPAMLRQIHASLLVVFLAFGRGKVFKLVSQ